MGSFSCLLILRKTPLKFGMPCCCGPSVVGSTELNSAGGWLRLPAGEPGGTSLFAGFFPGAAVWFDFLVVVGEYVAHRQGAENLKSERGYTGGG